MCQETFVLLSLPPLCSSACLKSASNRSLSSLLITEAFSQETWRLMKTRPGYEPLSAIRNLRLPQTAITEMWLHAVTSAEKRGGTMINKHFPRKTPGDGLMCEVALECSSSRVLEPLRLCSNRETEHKETSFFFAFQRVQPALLQISHCWKSCSAG